MFGCIVRVWGCVWTEDNWELRLRVLLLINLQVAGLRLQAQEAD